MLRRLLQRIAQLDTRGEFSLSVVVSDNDAASSAQPVVEECARGSSLPIEYAVQPERNIALARNTAVLHATGDFIAFIDDDELPGPHWLSELFRAIHQHDSDGVLGPVLPQFEKEPPEWVVKSGLFERPCHPTGHVLRWFECRTGNVLLRRSVLTA